eukprot:2336141-Rhodomonas_salina.1
MRHHYRAGSMELLAPVAAYRRRCPSTAGKTAHTARAPRASKRPERAQRVVQAGKQYRSCRSAVLRWRRDLAPRLGQ